LPEGDSLRRLARQLAPIVGEKVIAFSARRIADADTRSIVGQTVREVTAQGKNLVVRFEDGRALHVHLRMQGRVFITEAKIAASRAAYRAAVGGTRPSDSPELSLRVGPFVVTGSRLPVVRLLRGDVEGLGPDVLAGDFDEARAVANLRGLGDRAIGEAVMLQRAVAGIGNIYKSESLFLERVDPRAPVAKLDDDALRGIVRRARGLMQRAVAKNEQRTRWTLTGPHVWVYGRAGEPCLVCGTVIERIYQGEPPGRSTYLCPACQPQRFA
jgi:endonuclease-8